MVFSLCFLKVPCSEYLDEIGICQKKMIIFVVVWILKDISHPEIHFLFF